MELRDDRLKRKLSNTHNTRRGARGGVLTMAKFKIVLNGNDLEIMESEHWTSGMTVATADSYGQAWEMVQAANRVADQIEDVWGI